MSEKNKQRLKQYFKTMYYREAKKLKQKLFVSFYFHNIENKTRIYLQ